jgi:hypothetical protein
VLDQAPPVLGEHGGIETGFDRTHIQEPAEIASQD